MNHNSNNPNTAGIKISLPNSSNKGFDIKAGMIDSNPIFSNTESISNNSTNQPFSYQDSHTTAKEIINKDNTSTLVIESKTNLLEYQGNTTDTLMSGISGVFASIV